MEGGEAASGPLEEAEPSALEEEALAGEAERFGGFVEGLVLYQRTSDQGTLEPVYSVLKRASVRLALSGSRSCADYRG